MTGTVAAGGALAGATLALGEPGPLEELPTSFAGATRVLETAHRVGRTGLVDLGALSWRMGIGASPETTALHRPPEGAFRVTAPQPPSDGARLEGRRALVTCGASGIGAACARAFAAAGAHVTVDAPRPADAPALARVHTEGWRVAYGHLLDASWFGAEALARRTRQWEHWLDPASGTPGVFRAGRDACGTVVGVAGSLPSRDEPPVRERELTLLYIDTGWYGTGLGAALLDATLGDGPASLWVAEDNPRARRFYEKHGFRPDGTRTVDAAVADLVELRMVR